MGVQRLDHVGVVVNDLEAVTSFFLDLGLERESDGDVIRPDGDQLEMQMTGTW